MKGGLLPCSVHIVEIGERTFSRRSFAVARHTVIAAASSARRDSGRKRRRYAGKVSTVSGLGRARAGKGGGDIESQLFAEIAKLSCAA